MSRAKGPGQAVRGDRRADSKRWVQVGPRSEEAPPLPVRFRGEPTVEEWWRRVWSSPIAGAYLDVDVAVIERGAMLVSAISSGDFPTGYLAALARIEDRIGLTPGARQQLGWLVSSGPEEEPEPAPVVDMRDRLRRIPNPNDAA